MLHVLLRSAWIHLQLRNWAREKRGSTSGFAVPFWAANESVQFYQFFLPPPAWVNMEQELEQNVHFYLMSPCTPDMFVLHLDIETHTHVNQ